MKDLNDFIGRAVHVVWLDSSAWGDAWTDEKIEDAIEIPCETYGKCVAQDESWITIVSTNSGSERVFQIKIPVCSITMIDDLYLRDSFDGTEIKEDSEAAGARKHNLAQRIYKLYDWFKTPEGILYQLKKTGDNRCILMSALVSLDQKFFFDIDGQINDQELLIDLLYKHKMYYWGPGEV